MRNNRRAIAGTFALGLGAAILAGTAVPASAAEATPAHGLASAAHSPVPADPTPATTTPAPSMKTGAVGRQYSQLDGIQLTLTNGTGNDIQYLLNFQGGTPDWKRLSPGQSVTASAGEVPNFDFDSLENSYVYNAWNGTKTRIDATWNYDNDYTPQVKVGADGTTWNLNERGVTKAGTYGAQKYEVSRSADDVYVGYLYGRGVVNLRMV